MTGAGVLLAAFLLDRLLGDPPHWPHPVRAVGRLVTALEPALRRRLPERAGGGVLLLTVAGASAAAAWLAVAAAAWLHPWAGHAAAAVLVFWGLAARGLADETLRVLPPAEAGDWPEARRRLAMIVGRDTDELPPEDVYRACVETVGENFCDGVVAPLLYAAVLGPAGLWAFKAVSTLDSMVGYRDDRYRRFGWASARADDALNWVPARLGWLFLAAGAALTGHDGRRALAVGWRDGRKHPSPNSGWGEAAMAGALGVRLGGPSTYRGRPSAKPHLGDPTHPLTAGAVRSAVRVMRAAAWLALAGACGLAAAAAGP